MKKSIFILLFISFVSFLSAQYQIGLIPRVSPDKAIYQKVGHTEVDIHYGSPSAKGRQIWGNLVSYDAVWRAGANNATTISFSAPVTINNMELDSGTYAFFVIPRKNKKWTVIFNETSKQWGSFDYDSKKDALRMDVIPRRTSSHSEELTYSISQLGFEFASIILSWGHMQVEVPFETNYVDAFITEVNMRATTIPEHIKWVLLLQGAEHLENVNSNLDQANSWIDEAESLMESTDKWNAQYYPKDYIKAHVAWTKAKLMARKGDLEAAAKYGEIAKKGGEGLYYKKRNRSEGIDEKLEEWQER